MKKMTFKRNKLGFTLAEFLLVVAILVILVGLGVTGFIALRRNIVIAKYDDLAREIYVAAQNQLTRMEANGMDEESLDALELGSEISVQPSDYTKADWEQVKSFYRRADQGNTETMAVLLPLGTMADDVRSNGFYVIEYNVQTRTVYGVFYSEKSFDYSTVSTMSNFRSSRDVRKGPMVGYYGGSIVERDPLAYCEVPQLEIINNNELRLNILNVPEGVTVSVKISDGEHEVPAATVDEFGKKTVLLDSILEPNKHLWELFPGLTPGKDLTFTVTYEKEGAISSSASITANSLFATREPGEGGNDVVTLAWARHLQNLENSVSHLNDPAIVTARQTEHIQWEDAFGNFVSIRNTGVNENLLRFEGSGLEIRDLKGTNGLFAETKNNMSLSGIRIVNPVINAEAAGTEPVGALVGSAAPGTRIHMCGVYSHKLKADQTVDYDAYSACYVNGGSAVTGGLVGRATNTEVTYSFAALPALKGGSGASMIGQAADCQISNSYANCDDLKPGFSYFTTGSGNTITHCYAVGNVESQYLSSFCGTSDDGVTDCYYAVSHRKFAENWEDNEDLALTQFCYKGTSGAWQTIDQEKMENATQAGEWAESWVKTIAPLSHPYREYLDGKAFPYPAISELDHYGSWPDSDGKVDLKITMELLNNRGAGYAIFAGQVIVKDKDGIILFDSNDHKNADGTFDGQDTIQVAPNTQVRFEITAASGYDYLYSTIGGTRFEPTNPNAKPIIVDYTVKKNTEAVVTFRQMAFSLTGMVAENMNGHGIYNSSYDIDLTSPVKTLHITNAPQTEQVETGSTVTVRPKIPAGGYAASVVWYAPRNNNSEGNRTYLTEGTNGGYTFVMPSEDTEVHVMYTKKEAFFTIQYYLMDTDGHYPEDTNPTKTSEYKCGLGAQINQSMINSMAESSGLPLTIDKERVRYLAEAKVFSHKNSYQDLVFHSKLDETGKVTTTSPHVTKDGETSSTQPYIVKIYIARKEYDVTLTADEHVSGVRFGSTGDFQPTVTKRFHYGATVTAQANVAPGYRFTYWDPQDSRFMMSAETEYTFQVPNFNLNMKASAASDRHLVTINLLQNDESWLFSDASRQKDPITLTLVNSKDPTKTYPMQVLTEDTISYAMQAVVPAISEYEAGYYVQVNYKSGLKTWIYTSGAQDGTDESNTKLLLYVRDKAVEETVKFYSVTYHPNKKLYSGSAPKGGTFPMYYHLAVEGNSGLLRNLTDGDNIFAGWKDYYAGETGSNTVYTGKEILMVTRRTDMFAQWTDSLKVTYHAGAADGGTLPVDRNEYRVNEKVIIQWGSLTRKGYQFIGWSQDPNAVTPEFAKDGIEYILIELPLDLYPVWKQEEYTIQFYDIDGNLLTGGSYEITGKHYGDTVEAPRSLPDGADFIGWSLTKGGAVSYSPGETFKVTGNTKLYACFAADKVQITYKSADGSAEYKKETFGKGIPGYLSYVPTIGGKPTPVTAWSTQPNGKGTLYFCDESGRSEIPYAFTKHTTLYAVTGKVYNYNTQSWYNTLYDAKDARETQSGHTLIVYRDTVEPHNIWFDKSLNVIASGNRTVKWMDGATVADGDHHRLDDPTKETKEFVGCMGVGGVTVTFGKSEVSGLVPAGSTLTFDANRQSRVISLGNNATFHMYDGVTLTNGLRDVNRLSSSYIGTNGRDNANSRTAYGGGVYAGAGAVFYMHGGTVSYCEAISGGGVYLLMGSKMYMGDMVKPTAFSATAIYYEKTRDTELNEDIYINVEGVTAENYKDYYITTGNPQICYNTSTQRANSDGGGGLLMLDLNNGDLTLFRGSITNNTTSGNGGGIMTDSGPHNRPAANKAKLRIYEVDVSHNNANSNGGGIFQWQGTVYVYNSTIRQNKAQNGGGIYLSQGNNETCNVEFYFGDISDNEATGNGGGVYAKGSGKLFLRGGNLCRNKAKNGGGAYLEGAATLDFEKGTLIGNTAKSDGGGVYSSGTVNMTGGTLSGNNAEHYGGGIYTNGTMNMSGGTVCDNNGRYLGGGIMAGGILNLSGGSLYGNTDTDFLDDRREDEDNVNPGPNDIYLSGDCKITIPAGGIALSGEKRVAVDCERDDSLRFSGKDEQHRPPYRFAVYANEADFKASDSLLFSYYGTRSTQYSMETLGKPDLTVVSHNHSGLEGKDVGLYLVEMEGDGISSYMFFNLNYPGCPEIGSQTRAVGEELNLNDEVPNATREGYYLAGWARTPDALEEQYELFYDVVADVWRSGYEPGAGWTKEDAEPKYTVKNLFSQTLYAMWRPCVVVYDVGDDAKANGVTIQSTGIGPHVTLLNPDPVEYKVGDKSQRFLHWKNSEDPTDTQEYKPMQELDLKKNLRLKAVWEERVADSYIITFYFNDGTSDQTGELRREVVVGKDESYTIDVEVHQANKILVGWNTSPDGTGTKYDLDHTFAASELERDLDLYAMWVDAVTLTYDENGGNGSGVVESHPKDTDVPISDRWPEREGYLFQGWALDPNAAEAEYHHGESIKLEQNTTLYAVWKVDPSMKLWKISFNLNGGEGTGFKDREAVDGREFVLPSEAPVKHGCVFAGWTCAAGTYKPGNPITVTSDIEFVAKWQYEVTFAWNDGVTENWVEMVDEGNQLSLTQIPVVQRDGYILKGWSELATATAAEFGPDEVIPIEKSMKLYAVWVKSVTVTFNLNGGSINGNPDNPEKILERGAECSLNLEVKPTKEGFIFQGWSRTAAATAAEFAPEATITVNENMDLYAVWAEAATLTYNINGGTNGEIDAVKAAKNSQVTITNAVPEKAGYVFKGWADDPNAAEATYHSGGSFTLAGNTTLYAVWAEAVTISFDWNDQTPSGNMEKKIAEKGRLYTVGIEPPEREGYRFAGWSESRDTSVKNIVTGADGSLVSEGIWNKGEAYKAVDADTTLYAVWVPTGSSDIWQIQFDLREGMWSQETGAFDVNGGDDFTIPSDVPTRDGYQFKGWKVVIRDGDNSEIGFAQPGSQIKYVGDHLEITDEWEQNPSAPSSESEPTVPATEEPTVPATEEPTVPTTEEPTVPATEEPTVPTTEEPTVPVTEEPTVPATEEPTVPATEEPTVPATEEPTVPATEEPTVPATEEPTVPATEEPTVPATEEPTVPATEEPTVPATEEPTVPATEASASPAEVVPEETKPGNE